MWVGLLIGKGMNPRVIGPFPSKQKALNYMYENHRDSLYTVEEVEYP